ncbi:MAG: alkaline phosphatase family protein [Nocardioidaceae bacterium]
MMTQDGHSFDNYLGTRAGVDGLPSGICRPVSHGSATPCFRPHPISGSPHATLLATAGTQSTSDGRTAMGYYRPGTLPVLNGVVDHGVVFDHWFAAVPGGGVANRLFAVAARAPGDVAEVPGRGWAGITMIFDRLQAAGVSWRIYVENYRPSLTLATARGSQRRGGQLALVPLLASSGFRTDPSLSAHVVDLSRYYSDLARGRLPSVSFVVSTTHTEQPPHDPAVDQRLVRSVVNALLASSAWRSSAFFLTYDTPGGWYDHAPPSQLDGARTGLRVPTVLLSPYAQPGTVDHTAYDSAAILGLIEHNWNLPPLTSGDRTAASLLPAFSFSAPPRSPALIDVPATRPPVHQPNTLVLYAGYLLALLIGLGFVAWVIQAERPRRTEGARP